MLTFDPIAEDNRTVLYSDTISTDLRYTVGSVLHFSYVTVVRHVVPF